MTKQGASGRVAAFFDLDGTLIGHPSLERRFVADLRWRRAIPIRNYLAWLSRAAWLAPRGVQVMKNANKAYLRGLSVGGCREDHRSEEHRQRAQGPAGLTAPRFFPEGVNQVAWHARQGHAIVLVSGTLAPLAQEMALALVVRLAVRGIVATVGVRATRLEEVGGSWTGRILGDAMFGEAKGRAVERLAQDEGFALEHCYAYGNSFDDRWMLAAVGRPVVVNPSERLEKLARRRGWAVVAWLRHGLTQTSQRPQSIERSDDAILGRSVT